MYHPRFAAPPRAVGPRLLFSLPVFCVSQIVTRTFAALSPLPAAMGGQVLAHQMIKMSLILDLLPACTVDEPVLSAASRRGSAAGSTTFSILNGLQPRPFVGPTDQGVNMRWIGGDAKWPRYRCFSQATFDFSTRNRLNLPIERDRAFCWPFPDTAFANSSSGGRIPCLRRTKPSSRSGIHVPYAWK